MKKQCKEECFDCKYCNDNKCIHPNSWYCKHSELWTPKWFKPFESKEVNTYDYY